LLHAKERRKTEKGDSGGVALDDDKMSTSSHPGTRPMKTGKRWWALAALGEQAMADWRWSPRHKHRRLDERVSTLSTKGIQEMLNKEERNSVKVIED